MSCPMLFPSSGQAPLAQPHLVRTTERHRGFSGKERVEIEKPKQTDRLTGGDTGNLWHSRTERRHGSVPSPPDEPPQEPGHGRTPSTAQRRGRWCPRVQVCCSSQLHGVPVRGRFTSVARGKVDKPPPWAFLKSLRLVKGGCSLNSNQLLPAHGEATGLSPSLSCGG